MRGGRETAGEVGASPAESADEFVFDTYMSLSRMGGGNVDYGVTKINKLREGLALNRAFGRGSKMTTAARGRGSGWFVHFAMVDRKTSKDRLL